MHTLHTLWGPCIPYMVMHADAGRRAQVMRAEVYVGARYSGWQEAALRFLAPRFNAEARSFPSDTVGSVRRAALVRRA